VRLRFSVGFRKTIDPEYLVECDDSGAQDRGCIGPGAPGTHLSFTLFANRETRASPNVTDEPKRARGDGRSNETPQTSDVCGRSFKIPQRRARGFLQ
jgi:hypothetical protein